MQSPECKCNLQSVSAIQQFPITPRKFIPKTIKKCKCKCNRNGMKFHNNLRARVVYLHPTVANQPAPYKGLSGPLGPKCRKSLENVSGASGPGTPKGVQKVSGTIRKDSFDSFRRLSGDIPALRNIFETFSAFRARRARETSVRGGLVRNPTVRLCLGHP